MHIDISEFYIEERLVSRRTVRKVSRRLKTAKKAGKMAWDVHIGIQAARGRETTQDKLKKRVEDFKKKKLIQAKKRIAARKKRLAARRKKKR